MKTKPKKVKIKKIKKTRTNKSQKSKIKTAKKLNTKKIKRIVQREKPVKKSTEIKEKKFKPNRKIRYTHSELEYFKEIILRERANILESAKANMRALVDSDSGEYVGDNLTYATHMAEQGTDEMEREKNYLFVQRDEKYLGYLQEALLRIDQGTYGVCIDCIEIPKNLCKTCPLIPKERLEIVPITQHCIECKNRRG